ncbi:hypothetical protein ACH4T9_10575 [Micromonospora sp. NPDC020750]|uniref:hypothetical protein n=1 Tax=unclassified Micromonospora TaxID=2617518 RepID=UPI0037A53F3E
MRLAILSDKDFTDEPAIVAGVLTSEKITAAQLLSLAKQVADEIARRMADLRLAGGGVNSPGPTRAVTAAGYTRPPPPARS